jgi:hypothetical protein
MISGTKPIPTSEPGVLNMIPSPNDSNSPEPSRLEEPSAPEELAIELEQQLAASSLEILPGEGARRFSLIVTGTTPGLDLVGERELILKTIERALMGLHVTHGIGLIGAAYRSDPIPSEATDTVPDVLDTTESSEEPGESSDAQPEPGPLDGSPSGQPESDSSSPSTSS